ncbi:hypothetical protein [Natronoflexus pectinivorans]|uniref:Uncharacterized protein n=1 Tax=Natronoflexus pectinivorans TaxID=682526 RepID=A0A4V6NMS6_9BACT|nr:hypothetical protein [Natronoflexus pectinivorans]TCO10911.1 hypothetical protein EV194_101545 [Natronoflexus pectinivorans]
MRSIILKEIILSLVVFFAGLFVFRHLEVDIFTKWVYFSILLFVLFVISTLFVKYLIDSNKSWVALGFAGITFFCQIILLLILFIFLEPEETNHRIVAKVGVVSYLTFLGFDTFWKIKWLFPKS